MIDPPLSGRPDVERWIGMVLRVGILGSSGLMVLGLLMSVVQPSQFQSPLANPSLRELASHFLEHPLDASTLMYAGLVCLMLTPIFRVLTALLGFAVERDRPFVLVSLVVFLMLLAEVLVSSH